jgi:hypothetical protein
VTDAPTGPSLSVRTRTLRRESNRGRIRRGAIAAAAAIGLMVGGLVLGEVRGAITLADPLARGDRGELMTFEASARRYDIIVALADPVVGLQEREVNSTRCTVTFADRTTTEIRGDRQGVSEETSFGRTAGYFRAVAGTTTVLCDNLGGSTAFDRFMIAPRTNGLHWASWGLMALGLVVGMVAAWLIHTGVRGRVVFDQPPESRAA